MPDVKDDLGGPGALRLGLQRVLPGQPPRHRGRRAVGRRARSRPALHGRSRAVRCGPRGGRRGRVDARAGGRPARAGLRGRCHPGHRLRRHRPGLPDIAPPAHVRHHVHRVGDPRARGPGGGHPGGARLVLARGVPRPPAVRGGGRGDDGAGAAGARRSAARHRTRRPRDRTHHPCRSRRGGVGRAGRTGWRRPGRDPPPPAGAGARGGRRRGARRHVQRPAAPGRRPGGGGPAGGGVGVRGPGAAGHAAPRPRRARHRRGAGPAHVRVLRGRRLRAAGGDRRSRGPAPGWPVRRCPWRRCSGPPVRGSRPA